jgi:hypothetical protein
LAPVESAGHDDGVRLLLLLLIGLFARPGTPALDVSVPRSIMVSVGKDHLWASLRATVAPKDVGLDDWSRYDRDGDGVVGPAEERALLAELRRKQTEHTCIALGEAVVPLGRLPVKRVGAGALELTSTIALRIEGRVNAPLDVGTHPFVLHDRPNTADGVVPIRLAWVQGVELLDAQGTRAERKGARRIEAVVTHQTPALWGRLSQRTPAPPP